MTTFKLPDPYEGWTEDRLKGHCRRLGRAYSEYQQIILFLVEHGPHALPEHWKAEVESLRRAYSDDQE